VVDAIDELKAVDEDKLGDFVAIIWSRWNHRNEALSRHASPPAAACEVNDKALSFVNDNVGELLAGIPMEISLMLLSSKEQASWGLKWKKQTLVFLPSRKHENEVYFKKTPIVGDCLIVISKLNSSMLPTTALALL